MSQIKSMIYQTDRLMHCWSIATGNFMEGEDTSPKKNHMLYCTMGVMHASDIYLRIWRSVLSPDGHYPVWFATLPEYLNIFFVGSRYLYICLATIFSVMATWPEYFIHIYKSACTWIWPRFATYLDWQVYFFVDVCYMVTESRKASPDRFYLQSCNLIRQVQRAIYM